MVQTTQSAPVTSATGLKYFVVVEYKEKLKRGKFKDHILPPRSDLLLRKRDEAGSPQPARTRKRA